MASWLDNKAKYDAMAKTIDPSIRLRGKQSSGLMRAYAKLPWLGQKFLEETATVIGPIHWYPENWSDIEKELYHEGRHTRQKRWFGLGIHPWVGLLPFALVSVFLLPVLFTVRFWLELDAETFALKHKYKTGSSLAYVNAELIEFAETLAGPDYLWSWPKKWARRIAERRVSKMRID